MKIWNKNIKTSNSSIDTFLSGEDIVLDQELFLYDIEASIAEWQSSYFLVSLNLLIENDFASFFSVETIFLSSEAFKILIALSSSA